MSIQVKSIDVNGIEARLRKDKSKGGIEVWQYVKALKEALKRQQELTAHAISKLRNEAEEEEERIEKFKRQNDIANPDNF